ncbi:MAG: DUF3592 domain-containing protein [Clostridia bacterium]|nr:DUF3592 domain-containing protein [Clostridia bacterium]
MSFKGIGIKVFAVIIAIVAIAAGVYFTFFQSKGFVKTDATIVDIKVIPSEFSNDDPTYEVTVQYTVDGTQYTEKLGSYSPSYKVGKTISVLYDPNDPKVVHEGGGMGIYVLIVGIVILAVVIFSTVRKKQSLKKVKAAQNGATYQPSELGAERELYFITDTGTPKYGHRIEDSRRKVLIEAKMTKFTLTSPFGFDFINHENGKTTPHLIGHEEESQWGTLLLDSHYTISFDGEDIWKHLKRNGIKVDSSYGGGSGKLLGTNYVIFRDGVEIARVESTGSNVHEEDAETKSKLGTLVPVQGFFRIWTREQNLDLLFVTLIAFARTGASADNGGNYKTLFNTFRK